MESWGEQHRRPYCLGSRHRNFASSRGDCAVGPWPQRRVKRSGVDPHPTVVSPPRRQPREAAPAGVDTTSRHLPSRLRTSDGIPLQTRTDRRLSRTFRRRAAFRDDVSCYLGLPSVAAAAMPKDQGRYGPVNDSSEASGAGAAVGTWNMQLKDGKDHWNNVSLAHDSPNTCSCNARCTATLPLPRSLQRMRSACLTDRTRAHSQL